MPYVDRGLFLGLLIGWLTLATERFYGFTENTREVEMDMREMVDKVKKGEPLYGKSQVSSYLQGVAARNSRYSQLFIHVLPWINVVNHDQVSFDLPRRPPHWIPTVTHANLST